MISDNLNIVIMGIIIFFDIPCDPEDEGTIVLQNISNCLPSSTQ